MIELPREVRAQAVVSVERWFRENMQERIGNIAAGALLDFFVEEVGPAVYNQAVADVQAALLARVNELDLDHHEDAFQFWRRDDKAKKR
jgi:uncharacterized protein (DUF2164 family)